MPALLRVGLGAGGGLTDVDFTLTAATLVLFLIFAVVLGRFGWKPLLHMVEEREKGVREAVESAQKSSDEAAALLEKHRELLKDAGREREEIVQRALKEAEQLKAELSARARAESDSMIARARDQIGREKTQAIQELRAHVADIAMEAAAKIVTSSLTPETQRKLIDQTIANLDKQ